MLSFVALVAHAPLASASPDGRSIERSSSRSLRWAVLWKVDCQRRAPLAPLNLARQKPSISKFPAALKPKSQVPPAHTQPPASTRTIAALVGVPRANEAFHAVAPDAGSNFATHTFTPHAPASTGAPVESTAMPPNWPPGIDAVQETAPVAPESFTRQLSNVGKLPVVDVQLAEANAFPEASTATLPARARPTS